MINPDIPVTDVKGLSLFKNNTVVDIYGLIKELNSRYTASGKPYVDIVLSDKGGTVDVKIWDATGEELPANTGDAVKIRGAVGEWNSKPQLTVKYDRTANPFLRKIDFNVDEVKEDDLIACAPISGQELWQRLKTMVDDFENHELKAIILKFLTQYEQELLYYPGGESVHHAVKSGLLYHIYGMVIMGEGSAAFYGLDKELLISGAIIHDIGKLKEYQSNENGIVLDRSVDGQLLGHMIIGVDMLDELACGVDISPECLMLLKHMIISHHYDETWGAYQKPMFPEAELLHHLDLMDSRMNIMMSYYENLQAGEFSEKNYWLGRRAYKPKL
ncbi:MAG: HD domain-containing protein [Clostridia bacterium]|jgi:3'-5' exoribonuclease|nr:HD domain-containing protein [Clostridia bacterium]